MALSSSELLDDNVKLEPKVVFAISRLTRLKKSRRATGIACKQIVEYLNTHYGNLDGDVESQVLTALLSCVKNGIICALDNGKYILPGPGSKGIISKCITRSTHGPKCSCSAIIKPFSKNFQNACCVFKSNSGTKKGRKSNTKSKQQSMSPRKRTIPKSKHRKCAQGVQQMVEERCSSYLGIAEEVDGKCSYCMEIHTLRGSSSQELCKKCHPYGLGYVAPFDKFSPREENL